METCVFCQILTKKEKASIIYENDYVCCFFDKYPINLGHILVIPKIHYQEFSEVDRKSLSEVILIAQKITQLLEKILHTDGITIMQNNGIFKDVNHYHMHIIPRFEGDGFSWIEPTNDINENDVEQLKLKLIDSL
ncbi:diadenosine tetraphosphate (Ap4A) HIT family hydrolase [Cytobacillus eiseniae]|uniref:Diadenosine tetraphosphate (Ap4A) HIT family hydrolase n=1 Tax=Cytobacillus eiseniae TaxID=762947 RepID=A0ABS4R9F4_9BACI|nr:diadenosine tetraphosphate (Ap4A) HIT family hydrolase [Cytobacillus eiseniae]